VTGVDDDYYGGGGVRVLSRPIRKERDNSVGIVTGCGLDVRGIRVRFAGGARYFFIFSTVPGPSLGPTQPPIQWAPGSIPGG
jgi:hypothetical protein